MPSSAEVELHPVGLRQRLVLAGEAGVGAGEDAAKSSTDSDSSLTRIGKRPQLGDQIRGLGQGGNAPLAMNRM